MLKKFKLIRSILLSLFCVYALSTGYIIKGMPLIPSNSILSVVYFITFTYLFFKAFDNNTIREYIVGAVGAIILASCNCIGCRFVTLHQLEVKSDLLYLNILGLALVFTAVFIIVFKNINTIEDYISKIKIPDKVEVLINISNRKKVIIFFCFFIICWIPAFLAMFPGNLTYDGPIQIDQLFRDHQLNQHHPIIHTLFIDLCFYIGGNVFGSYNIGLMIYSIIQAVILAMAFSYLCMNLVRWNVPNIIVLLSAIFLGINPIIQIFVFTTAKDVLFSAFMVTFIIFIINIIKDPGDFYNNRTKIFIYVLSIIFMTFMRKQGVYIFILCIPLFLIIGKMWWKKIIAISTLCIVCPILILAPIKTIGKAKEGPAVEALSVPIQQISRVMNEVPETIDDEEKSEVYKFMDEDVIKRYIPEISDPVKDKFNEEELKDDPYSFFNTWLKLGIQHPGIYINSFLYGCVGYFYPSNDVNNQWSTVMKFYHPEAIQVDEECLFPEYRNYLDWVGNTFFENIPVLPMVINGAFVFWALVIASMILIYKRNYKMMIPLAVIFIFWCSLLLGPVFCVRYTLPMLVYLPVIITIVFVKE